LKRFQENIFVFEGNTNSPLQCAERGASSLTCLGMLWLRFI